MVVKRAFRCCEYCKSQRAYATEFFTIDHIIPTIKGGTNEFDNLAYSCSGCNTLKSDITSILLKEEQEWIALHHPRLQKWEDHFAWNGDYTEVIGLTDTGRVTTELLRMNRASLKNLREVLVISGKHPPVWY